MCIVTSPWKLANSVCVSDDDALINGWTSKLFKFQICERIGFIFIFFIFTFYFVKSRQECLDKNVHNS